MGVQPWAQNNNLACPRKLWCLYWIDKKQDIFLPYLSWLYREMLWSKASTFSSSKIIPAIQSRHWWWQSMKTIQVGEDRCGGEGATHRQHEYKAARESCFKRQEQDDRLTLDVFCFPISSLTAPDNNSRQLNLSTGKRWGVRTGGCRMVAESTQTCKNLHFHHLFAPLIWFRRQWTIFSNHFHALHIIFGVLLLKHTVVHLSKKSL